MLDDEALDDEALDDEALDDEPLLEFNSSAFNCSLVMLLWLNLRCRPLLPGTTAKAVGDGCDDPEVPLNISSCLDLLRPLGLLSSWGGLLPSWGGLVLCSSSSKLTPPNGALFLSYADLFHLLELP